MSDYNVIRDTSETMQQLLYGRLNTSDQQVAVTVDSPHKENMPEPRVNLFLYLIRQDEFRRNTGRILPRPQNHTPGQPYDFYDEPLALNLYYLMTAFAQDGLSEHRLLGQAMQIFFENQILPNDALKGSLATSVLKPEKIQLVLLNHDLETINNIWGNNVALLRASVAYEVSVSFLERQLPEQPSQHAQAVETRHFDVVPVPYLTYIEPSEVQTGQRIKIYGANVGMDYLKVRVGDSTISSVPKDDQGNPAPEPDQQYIEVLSANVIAVTVPSVPAGKTEVRLQLEHYISQARVIDVLA